MSEVFTKDFHIYPYVDLSKLNNLEANVFLNFLENEETSVMDLLVVGSFAYCSREMRKLHKITQKELSKDLNIAENTIYNYENGKTEPSKKTKQIVKERLSISDYFLEIFNKIEKALSNELHEKKKEIEKDSKYMIILNEKINKYKENVVLKEILKVILDEKKLKFEEINNLINSFIMLSSNPSIGFDFENNHVRIFYGLDAEIPINDFENMNFSSEKLSENIFSYSISVYDFIYRILLPISQYTSNIFINNNTTKSNLGLKKGAQNELNKQYKKLENILSNYLEKNKEGGSDE